MENRPLNGDAVLAEVCLFAHANRPPDHILLELQASSLSLIYKQRCREPSNNITREDVVTLSHMQCASPPPTSGLAYACIAS